MRTATRVLAMLLASGLVALAVAAPASAATPTGTIKGRVTDAISGKAAVGVTITIYDAGNAWAFSMSSGADGRYTAPGLPAGEYTLQFSGPAYVSSTYGAGAAGDPAQVVEVAGGTATSGIDIALTPAGRVTGVVRDASTGAPLDDVSVWLNDPSGAYAYTTTNAQGAYTLGGVPAGSHRLQFSPSTSGPYGEQQATVAVGAGATAHLDQVLNAQAVIRGQVTDAADGTPVISSTVIAYDDQGQSIVSTTTDASGKYVLGGLAAGAYRVGFGDYSSYGRAQYAPQFFAGRSTLVDADVVTTSVGHPGVADATLAVGGHIQGTVTDASSGAPMPNVYVDGFGAGGTSFGYTDANGHYDLGGLATGPVRVMVEPGYPPRYLTQYYNNKSSEAEADPVAAVAGQTKTGIDIALHGARIAGTLTDAVTGRTAGGVEVLALDALGHVAQQTRSDADGTYALSALRAGAYRIRFGGSVGYFGSVYALQWYHGVSEVASATPVTVQADQRVSGIDATMTGGGRIQGRVTREGTNSPIAGATVTVGTSTFGSYVDRTATTTADGTYSVGGLSAGSYQVRFSAHDAGVLDETYNNRPPDQAGDAVSVADEGTVQGVDGQLAADGELTGRVTDAVTHAGLAGVSVEVHHSYDGTVRTTTAADGTYSVRGLHSGTARVLFWTPSGYARLYNGGATAEAAAPALSIVPGSTVSGVDAALPPGLEIAGRVTDATTGTGLSQAAVQLYDASGAFVASADADATGHYAVPSLAPGAYRAQAFATGHIDAFYDHAATLAAATPITVSAGHSATGIDMALATGASISGTVTDATLHAALAFASITVTEATTGATTYASSDAEGHYAVVGLSPGSYRVGFAVYAGYPSNRKAYIDQYYNNVATIGAAQPVALTAGQARTGVDAAMVRAGAIAGTLTNGATNQPAGGVPVAAYDSSGAVVATTTSESDGTYVLSRLASGAYRVGFAGTGGQQSYVAEYHHDAASLGAATAVTVTAPQVTTAVNATLAPMGSVTGTVRLADGGAPLAGVQVVTTGPSGYTFTTSDLDGHYRLDGLATGSYTIFALPQTDDFVQSSYPSSVSVTTGQVTSGIDLSMTAAGHITGTVTDATTHAAVSGVTVQAMPMSSGFGASATTRADGSYDITGLAPGAYRVAFVNSATGPNYANTYYNGKAYITADPVTVTAGRATTGIDAALSPAGEITGRVIDARTSQALGGITVEAFDGDSSFVTLVTTQSDGNYHLRGLATGTYRIGFFDDVNGGDHVSQFYDGQPTLGTATTVHVVAGQSVGGVDAALATGGSITGQVTDATTGAALSGVTVTAQGVNGGSQTAATTGADGRYTLTGVPSGQIVVHFIGAGLHASKYYNNKDTAETADRVTVTTGVTTSGIDAALPMGGAIGGTVTGADNGLPLSGVSVRASTPDGSSSYGYTDGQGRYLVEGLDSGTYTVAFLPYGGVNYLRQTYGSAVSVTDGRTTAGIDGTLAVGGRVTGTVTDAVSHVPLPGVSVVGSSPTDTLGASYANTDQNGHYTLAGMPSGSVTISGTDVQGLHARASVTATAAVGETIDGADLALAPTGVITGHVTARDTGAPVPSAGVEVINSDGTSVASTYAYDGSFRVGELAAGSYKVRFTSGGSGASYGSIYYPAAATLADATSITVTAGEVHADIDGALFGPPVDLTIPTVSGTAKQGEVLTEGHGSWSQQPDAYTYRWLRCATGGGSCSVIAGATDSTYKLTNADAGFVIKAEETAANAAGAGAPATSAATAVVIPLPPVNAAVPTLSGIVQQGQTLTADNGNWINTPTSFTRQWLRCDPQGAGCTAIGGATGATYVPVAADVGATLAVAVTASNAGGAGAPATSATTAAVAPLTPTLVSAPTITGTAKQGATLTEHHGSWTNSPTSYTYQWQRCDALGSSCLPIGDATGQTYLLQAADVGATLVVGEIAANGGVPSTPAASQATAVVVAAPPVNQGAPTISGVVQQGHTLTLAHGAWSNQPSSYQDQWLRCDGDGQSCIPIDGATATTYAVVAADVDARLAVREVAGNAGGQSAPAGSAPTIVVTPAVPSTTGTPSIAGTAQQGHTLTVQHAVWANSPTSYAYQWRRCTALGTSCLPIGGAIGQSYVPVSDDVGSTLVVAETAANAGGNSLPAISPATAVVLSAPPVDQTPPTISGTARQGQTLVVVHGTWTNQPTSYRQQWYRCTGDGGSCATIAGATDTSYVLTADDVGHPLAVAEIATNAGGDSPPATSVRTVPVAPPPPVNLSAPQITGETQQGHVLTVQHGTWTNAPESYTYRWRRCDLTGSNCADIAGATAGQYTPVGADVGATLAVFEIAVNPGGDSDPAPSAETETIRPEPPAAVAAPTIVGIAQQGQPLTVRHGEWTNQPSSYQLQWLRCDAGGQGCSALAGATAERYVPVAEDVGHRLALTEIARNAGGDSPSARSEATATVLGPVPANLGPPTITGVVEQGQTLSAQHGSWSGDPTAYEVQWKRCVPGGGACVPIPGATGPTYTAATADVGTRLLIEEMARNGGAPSAPASSAPTALVAVPALHAVAGDPQRATVGQDVAFDAGASTPHGVIEGYSWDFGDGGSAIGATASHHYDAAGTYPVTLTITDAGHDATATTTVTVANRAPGARITVLAPGGQRMQGASLVYAAADGTRTTATTGADGVGVLVGLPDGVDAVYAWADGYRPAVAQVTVDGGIGDATVTLTSGQIATTTLESHPMTLAEIEAAGIDPNDPSNQNVWQFEVALNFTGPTGGPGHEHLCGHLNAAGQFVGQTGFDACGGSGSGGGGGPGSAGGDCGANSCHSGNVTAMGAIVNGHPLIEWLVLDGQVTTLKQFFSVHMVINNLSPEPFRLTGGQASLDLPGGLSLAPTAAPQAATRDVGEIAGLASADVTWIVRGDEPGRYGLTASYSGRLQPFDAPVDLSATLAEPLHVWGAEALGLKVQADAGTLQAGRPYHVRIGVTNRADVPFYNVVLGIDPESHDRFIFQPRERFEDTLGELSPGETTYGHVYVLVPDADSSGSLLPRMSRAAFVGQPVQPGDGVQEVTPPAVHDLKTLGDTVGSVHLQWDPVPGAQGYEVYSTDDLDTPFGDAPDRVQDFGGNAVTRLAAGATDAFIAADAGSERRYAVTTILAGHQTLSNAVVIGRPGVAPPVGVGGVSGAGGGALPPVIPGATNDQGYGAPKATCDNHSAQLAGVTVLATCFHDAGGGKLTARGQLRVNGFDLFVNGGATLDLRASTLTAAGSVDGYLGSMHVYHGELGSFSLKLGVGHTWEVPKGLKIKKLPATGSFSLSLTTNALTAEATAQIGNGDTAFAISGGITLKATLTDGLKLDGFHLELASDLPLKSLVIKQAELAYKATSAGDQWSGKVGVALPSGPEVAGSLTLLNGSIAQVGVNVSKINKPIGTIVYLQSLGLDVVLKPSLKATGSIGLTAGPTVLGKAAAALDGSLTFQLGPAVALKASGTLKVVTMNVASASLSAAIPGGVRFSGDMHRGFAGFDVDSYLSGSIDSKSFEAEGGATATVGPVSASGKGLVDQLGVAACVSGSALGQTVNLGGGYKWKSGNTGLLDGACGFDDLRKTIAHISAVGPASIAIPAGERQVNLIAQGTPGTAPAVTVTQGTAQATIQPGTLGRLGSTVYLAVADPAGGRTGIVLAAPRAGRVAVAPLAGEPPVSVKATALLPEPDVHVKVRSLGHRRYRLRWDTRRIPGQQLVFRETRGAAAQLLRRSSATHGSFTFTALDTPASVHAIQVVVDQHGLPRQVLRSAARFRVPRAVAGRPRVTIRQSRGRATIRWTRAAGASTYQVRITTADGRRLFFSRRASARALVIPGSTRVTASVRGVSGGAVLGPAGQATSRTH